MGTVMLSRAAAVRWIVLVILLAFAGLAAWRLPIGSWQRDLQEWIETLGGWGPLVFGGIYVLAVVLALPASPFTLVAGALFGLPLGFLIVSIASTTGVSITFLISRYAARGPVQRWIRTRPKFAAVDAAIEDGGWKVVVLLRLSPAIPFNVQNYLYGLTALRFWPYVLASWAAMIPGTFLYVYLGHVAGAAAITAASEQRQRSPWEWLFLIVGGLATLGVTLYVTRLARAKLKEVTG